MQSGTGSLEPCSVNPAFRASEAENGAQRKKSHAAFGEALHFRSRLFFPPRD